MKRTAFSFAVAYVSAAVCMAEPSEGRFHMRSVAHRGLHGPGIAQNSFEWAKTIPGLELTP